MLGACAEPRYRFAEDGEEGVPGLFSLDGRKSRLAFWRTLLLSGVALATLQIVALTLPSLTGVAEYRYIAGLAAIPFSGLLFSNTVERFHDRGKSGWWMVPLCVVPDLINGIMIAYRASGAPMDLPMLAFTLIGLGLGLWGVVELGFLQGTRGENRYGADPAPV